MDVTKCGQFAAFCINTEIVVLKIDTGESVKTTVSDIKLLNTFILNHQDDSFDLLSANGRQELIKTPVKNMIVGESAGIFKMYFEQGKDVKSKFVAAV